MRLWIISDLHQEFRQLAWKPETTPDHDVLVLAGDIHVGARNVAEYAKQLTDKPIILLAGNHEFYRLNIDDEIEELRSIASVDQQLNYLEDDTVIIGNVRFVGATLWPDFEVLGEMLAPILKSRAKRDMNDFEIISTDQVIGDKLVERKFTPDDAIARHRQSRRYIEKALNEPFDGKTVVVTHHAPHKQSIHAMYEGDYLNGAFVSDLSQTIEVHQPTLWIHGHVHNQFDYIVGKTRIICNSRGYDKQEQAGFRPELVVEV